jgi:hypothetical protein
MASAAIPEIILQQRRVSHRYRTTAKKALGALAQRNNRGKQNAYIIKNLTRHNGETIHQKRMPGQP